MRAKLLLLFIVIGVPFVSAASMDVLPNCFDDLSNLFSTYNLQHDALAVCAPVLGNVVKVDKQILVSGSGQQSPLYLPTPLLQDLIPREQISCADPTAITIAWLNLETGKWNEIVSDAEELVSGYFSVVSDPETNEAWQEALDSVEEGDFYLAVVKERRPITDLDACIELDCGSQLGFYHYDTHFNPYDASLVPAQTISFNVCGIPPGCTPAENTVCDEECSQGVDPDCATCTELAGDCCDIAGDGVCDQDCGESVDPDCVCSIERDGCCTGNCYDLDLDNDDPEQGDPDCNACISYQPATECYTESHSAISPVVSSTEDCPATWKNARCSNEEGDCCNNEIDGVCDSDCITYPLSPENESIGLWYADPDCCQGTLVQGASVIQGTGVEFARPTKDGCCKPECDGICDDDCTVGLDPDCIDSEYRGSNCYYCGDGNCDENIFDTTKRDRLKRALRRYRNDQPDSFVAMFSSVTLQRALASISQSDFDVLNGDTDVLVDALDALNENDESCPEDCDGS
ncbi:hypothetical protein HY501_00265 [Candidatus Woesearchaeota archaeon]|nr:hypothetical protein [Candidatus Woesearchaeota archaeon]